MTLIIIKVLFIACSRYWISSNVHWDLRNSISEDVNSYLAKKYILAHCWVYLMRIRQTQDMKSKCHIYHIFWKKNHYVISILKSDITIVPLFFQKIICSRDMRDVILWCYVLCLADDLIECNSWAPVITHLSENKRSCTRTFFVISKSPLKLIT